MLHICKIILAAVLLPVNATLGRLSVNCRTLLQVPLATPFSGSER
jgi:hypothetical protein